jgi:hypothetical protein
MEKIKKNSKKSPMNTLKDTLLAKLRLPIHISFISKHILKTTILETEKIIKEMIDEGLIEESKYGKGYYVVKNK